MTENINEPISALVCPTKIGNGFKVRMPNGEWLYASKKDFIAMVNGVRKSCVFSAIEDPSD